MDNIVKLARLCDEASIAYTRPAALRGYCTFKIGGDADILLSPAGETQVAEALRAARRCGVRLLVLGKGSNVLFADEGFRGAVLHIGTGFAGMRLLDARTIECESGAALASLCKYACEQGLAGLEFAYGIPGTVGGAVYMNAGAYGGEMRDVLLRAHHLGTDGEPGCFEGEEMQLSYRHSAYSDRELVITRAVLRLTPADPAEIRARMEDYLGRRREKQPLEWPSAGSTFKRPPGAYASALIDRCGLKGRRVGGAVVSEKHAGFVVNDGDASCADVLALIRDVQDEVRAQTGHELECEVKVIR